jgi:ribose 1,5-bisphosphokinase PhnN
MNSTLIRRLVSRQMMAGARLLANPCRSPALPAVCAASSGAQPACSAFSSHVMRAGHQLAARGVEPQPPRHRRLSTAAEAAAAEAEAAELNTSYGAQQIQVGAVGMLVPVRVVSRCPAAAIGQPLSCSHASADCCPHSTPFTPAATGA